MNHPLKLLFDENIGHPLVEALAKLLAFAPQSCVVKHLRDLCGEGKPDDQWIPQVVNEGYIVITADRAKRSGGPKLPQLCRERGVTHVLISGKLHQQRQFEKARAILVIWPDLVRLNTVPPGSRFQLRLSSSGSPRLVGRSVHD